MSKSNEDFVLRLRAVPQEDNVEKRLAGALKTLLRRHGFECITVDRAGDEHEREPTKLERKLK